MKVYLFTLLVRRSMYTEVPVTVPAAFGRLRVETVV